MADPPEGKKFNSLQDLAKASGVPSEPVRSRGGFRPPGNPRRDEGRGDQDTSGFMHEVWPGYLKDGYFDSGGNLKPEYVRRKEVMPVVEKLGAAKMTSSQLRRFFQHCRAIESLLKAKRSTWEKERASFMKLDVAAEDALGKRERKIPRLFHDFIKQNVAAVKTEEDFLEGFLPHFEALVGFGSDVFNRNERSRQ